MQRVWQAKLMAAVSAWYGLLKKLLCKRYSLRNFEKFKSLSCQHMPLLELQWIFTCKLFEGLVEVGEVFKATFITRFRNGLLVQQDFLCLVDAVLIQKIGER